MQYLLLITEGPCSISVVSFLGPVVIMDQQFFLPTDPPADKCNPIWASASENADVLRTYRGNGQKMPMTHSRAVPNPGALRMPCVNFPHSEPCHTQQTIMQIWSWNLWSAQNHLCNCCHCKTRQLSPFLKYFI